MPVTTELDGHIAVVTFARPPHNFADLELIEGVGAAFDAADADREVRAIVLRSEGRVFCAGADLVNANPVADGVTGARNPFYVAAAKLFGVGKPVVAAVQGAAVGAGLGLVFGWIAIRRAGIYFAMITLALAQMVYFFCVQVPFTRGEDGIQGIPRHALLGIVDLDRIMEQRCSSVAAWQICRADPRAQPL